MALGYLLKGAVFLRAGTIFNISANPILESLILADNFTAPAELHGQVVLPNYSS